MFSQQENAKLMEASMQNPAVVAVIKFKFAIFLLFIACFAVIGIESAGDGTGRHEYASPMAQFPVNPFL